MERDPGKLLPLGFSLVEVMVAVLVFSVGLLGFAALQISSLNNNQEAYLQSQALAVANDLASRMRANREYINWDVRAPLRDLTVDVAVDENIYSDSPYWSANPNTSNDPDEVCDDDPKSYNGVAAIAASVVPNNLGDLQCRGAAANCSAKQMAALDRWQVCRSATQLLPDGEVRVACRDNTAYTGNSLPTLPAMAAGPVNFMNPYFDRRLQPNNIPYHPVFNADGTADPGSEFLNGNDPVDACHPGSVYTIAVYWTPSVARSGTGERGVAGAGNQDTAINARCIAMVAPGPALVNASNVRKTCVLIDIIP
ncbi:MAG: type IV pilus modification protein PilV [Gammaproteobacteria bacterium]|nr:type IV pilus modification protein PilV [Gammaproteobacteria bacterium]